jgi:hypothetical protein
MSLFQALYGYLSPSKGLTIQETVIVMALEMVI